MRKLLNMLKKDDNAYSVGRICAVIGFAVWVLVTLWLAFGPELGATTKAARLAWWRCFWSNLAIKRLKRECLG